MENSSAGVRTSHGGASPICITPLLSHSCQIEVLTSKKHEHKCLLNTLSNI